MKLKNYVLFHEKFQASLLKLAKIDLEIKHAIALAKSIKEIGQEASVIFPIRNQIFQEYGITSATPIESLNDEQKAEVTAKLGELLDAEFEVTLNDKIVLDEAQIKGVLSADDLLMLAEIVNY